MCADSPLVWFSFVWRHIFEMLTALESSTATNRMRMTKRRRSFNNCNNTKCTTTRRMLIEVGLRLFLVSLVGVAVVEGADLVAVAPGDGVFPDYKCPLDTLNLQLECNIREAILYLNPANDPDESYNNIRLKTHDSDVPDFVYYWDQTRAVYVPALGENQPTNQQPTTVNLRHPSPLLSPCISFCFWLSFLLSFVA